jgi:two-component system sensor histidine kinase RegB
VQLMRREVERCRRILERMRVDAGESAGERFARISARELVSECLAEAEGYERAAVRVAFAAGAGDASALVPRRAFGQALRGLVDNARDASPDGVPVELRVGAAADGALSFDVVDRGPGIPDDLLARVGEPFFTTKPAGKGMGLGVFLARALVERLGGRFAIRSTPGSGTVATLTLPPQDQAS